MKSIIVLLFYGKLLEVKLNLLLKHIFLTAKTVFRFFLVVFEHVMVISKNRLTVPIFGLARNKVPNMRMVRTSGGQLKKHFLVNTTKDYIFLFTVLKISKIPSYLKCGI